MAQGLPATLAEHSPALVSEWHPVRNRDLRPEDVRPRSDRRAWWLRHCVEAEPAHEWEARIADRSAGAGCAVCKGIRVQAGVNDLASKRPDLASEWHPSRNGDRTPEATHWRTKAKIWWQRVCIEGGTRHEWVATAQDRVVRGDGCAVCRGFQVLRGVNDLATLRPDLAAEWDQAANGDLTPAQVTVASHRYAWWVRVCEPDGVPHCWRASIANRSNVGTDCPVCHGTVVQAGVNDLATLRPDLAAEWDQAANGDLTPAEVTVASSRRIHWVRQCSPELTHRWVASLHSRSKGSGCPRCFISRGETAVAEALDSRGIAYEREWRPGGVLGQLRFDFVLHGSRTLIEFDGGQHHQPVRWGSMTQAEAEAALTARQQRDARKDAWAAANGWLLIRLVNLETVEVDLAAILTS